MQIENHFNLHFNIDVKKLRSIKKPVGKTGFFISILMIRAGVRHDDALLHEWFSH